ncbi:alpha/beta hydrolase [Microbacterium sp. bgisy203]|uniref:alpha/beta hydrolase n=1 Tax=Microbacterium sp. bgisy203 TaxID=3413799 RepID=UPI003D73340B
MSLSYRTGPARGAGPARVAGAASAPDAAASAPSLILLHGYGADENDLARLAPLLAPDSPWYSVRAPQRLPHGGNAWFPITTPGRPDPSAVDEATETLWDWIDGALDADTPIIPVGFSQGGLMATQLLRTRPERMAATVVLGGFVLGAPQPADETLAASRPAAFWGRGEDDRVIAADAVARTAAWMPEHTTLTARTYPGLGHGISPEEIADVRTFLAG